MYADTGQHSDEDARLRVGCIRWQHDGMPIPGDSGEVLARDAVCLLDVPTHKTGTAFTKPADPLLGQAIEAWQAVRPDQPAILDPKTNEHAGFLFAFRARRVSKHYINEAITPMLWRKAGVPNADARGNITSHRPRSTIASQLYNAKGPMTLFELQNGSDTEPRKRPPTARRSPRTRRPGPTTTRATSPATSAPSRSSLTGTRSPPAPPRTATRGSTTPLATAGAPTPSSSSVSAA